MRLVGTFVRAASGHAEYREGGNIFYFPTRLAGAVVSITVTDDRPTAQHGVMGYLVLGRTGFAELTADGETFYFPPAMVGKWAALDVISPLNQAAPETQSSGFFAQVRAATAASAAGGGSPATDMRGPPLVNLTTGAIRVHADDDLEVLG